MDMTRFRDLLGFRLFFLIPLIGVIIFLPLTLIMIRSTGEQLMDQIVTQAKDTNELIERSIHYSMLKNRKEDVARIIEDLGSGTGVDGIRLYKKKGTIIFSTDQREIGQVVDVKAEQCTVCHSGERPLESVPDTIRPRVFQSSRGYRVLGVINPIRNEPSCVAVECHPPPSDQKILGLLDSKMSLESLDKTLAESRLQMLFYSFVGIFLIELCSGLFIYRMVHKPVKALAEGTRKVMEGDLDFSIAISGRDEIASLAQSFNSMVADLKRIKAENQEWARTLEDRVDQKARELKQAQDQMIQVAKMASMGKLAATVAHEINNPLGGILTYVKLLQKRLSSENLTPEECKTSVDQLQIIVNELKRCGSIVKGMLHFSKTPDSLFGRVDLHELIEKSLFIVNHHLEINRIKNLRELNAKDPVLIANGNQLQQAMISLFINAVEAMSGGDTLSVRTEDVPENDSIRFTVADNGKGIPAENLSSIFEPFFTTKQEHYGVGLGLSVVYGIVESHRGKIEVKSDPGVETAFIITLPRKREGVEQA